MKKIILILIILIIPILLRSLISGIIINLWQEVSTIKGMQDVNGLLSKQYVSQQVNVSHMFYLFIVVPFLLIRSIRINFNVKERLFNQEILFNICYIILILIIEVLWALSYIYPIFFIPYAVSIYVAVFKFKSIKIYIYKLYE